MELTMKKLLFMAIIIMVSALDSSVTEYTFASTAGTFAEITGGTTHGNSSNDNECFLAIPIGFSFTYNSVVYNTVSIATNGFIAMGNNVASSNVAISASTGTNNIAAALNRDIKSRDIGTLMSLSSGSAPNRVFTVQWLHYRRVPTATVNDDFSFQIRLLENGNKIEFVYGPFTAITSATAAAIQVGLRGDSNADFNNRTTTSSWSATTAGTVNNANCTLSSAVYPANGLTFTISPGSQEESPQAAFNPNPTNYATLVSISSNLSWACGGGIVDGYKIYLGTDNPPTNIINGNTQSATTYDPADFTYNTQYFWKIIPYNQNGDAQNCPVWTFSTILGQIEISTPVFSPPPGLYDTAISVSINSNTVPIGATIRFTTDGSDPTESSPIYTSPHQISAGQIVTIKAKAYMNSWVPSEVYTANYSTTNSWLSSPVTNIVLSGRSIVLSWPACTGASIYRVEYSTDPYDSYSTLTTTSSTTYTHTNVATSQSRMFYRVIARSGIVESVPSEVVGYVKYPCVAGLNLVALPMNQGYTAASEVGDAYSGYIDQINFWFGDYQVWESATYYDFGFWDPDFAVAPGSVVMIHALSPFNLYSIGKLPSTNAQYNIVFGDNTAMIPLNKSSLINTALIGPSIGNEESGNTINIWDSAAQSWVASVNYGGGYWDPALPTSIGTPMFLNSGSSFLWPTGPRAVPPSSTSEELGR